MNLTDRVQERMSAQDSGDAPTLDEEQLAGKIRAELDEIRGSASRISHEGIWLTNIAYLLGYSGMTYNTTTRSFVPASLGANAGRRSQVHLNKILPTIQNRLARLCKTPPRYDVRPESNDDDDKEAARLSLQVLTYIWEIQRVNAKRIPLYMWVQQAGHAWIKTSWDPTLGKPMVDPSTGERTRTNEGDVSIEVVSPLEVFPDPQAKSAEDIQKTKLFHAKVRKLDYFKQRYPEKGKLVKSEDTWLLSLQYDQRINAMNTQGGGDGNKSPKDSAIEIVKYCAPTEEYPNGRQVTVANGIVLEDKELPIGEIPFAKFDDICIGGKFYAESVITHLRPLQDHYNLILKKRAEWVRKLLAGKYIAPRGSNLSQEALNDQSGEVVEYKPMPSAPGGGQPTPMQVPNIPQYAYTEEEALKEQFNDVSGISEISRGTLPSASIPAIGMQLLIEQDDSRIGVETEQHEYAWADVGRYILKYVQKYYVMPRKLKLAGKNLEYTVKEFEGKDLRNSHDVIVIRGSTLPGSKTLRRQEVLNTYERGLLGDPNDPKVREKVLSSLEFGDTAELWLDFGLDMAQIKRGIEKMEQEIPVDIDKLDNHGLWIQELNRYRKTEKYTLMSQGSQALLQATIDAHTQWLLEMSGQLPPEPDMSAMLAPDQGMMGPGMDPMGGAPMEGPPIA